MKIIETTTCRNYGHAEFRLRYDPAIVPVEGDALLLVQWLESSVASGTRFNAGETVQFGWSVLQVRNEGDGQLTLWEPDLKSMPIEWVESVSLALAHTRRQKDVCESVGTTADLTFPSMVDSVIVCTRLGLTEAVVMERVPPKDGISGWFCGCRDDGHDHNDLAGLRRASLYEAAACHAPQIIPYLALPEGTLLKVDRHSLSIFRDGEPVSFKKGSYLAALCDKR